MVCCFLIFKMQKIDRYYTSKICKMVFFTIILLFFISNQAFAQPINHYFYFNHYTNNDGLSSNRINCIYEDEDGFIWLGTNDGLNLYNGVETTVFKHRNNDSTSLFNNDVQSIVSEPATGNLWIGTRQGVSYFDKSTHEFTRMFETGSLTIDYIVYDLKFDSEKRLWIGTSSGLFCYEISSGELIRMRNKSGDPNSLISNAIFHLMVDEEYGVFVSTPKGVDCVDPDTKTVKHLFESDSLKDVTSVFKDSKGNYWVCTEYMGLFKAAIEPERIKSFTNRFNQMSASDRIQKVLEDNDQNLFFLARDKGLYYYNTVSGKLSFLEPDIYDPNSLNSKAIISGLHSSSGIIWLGTYNKGVNFLDYNRKPFYHFKVNYKSDGLVSNNVRCFFQDREGAIWVGTKEGGGLSRFYPEKNNFENYVSRKGVNSLSSDYVFAINQLDEHTLMIGTFGQGIDLFDKQTKTFRNIKVTVNGVTKPEYNRIYSIFKDHSGQMWIASLNEVFRLDPNNLSFNFVDGVETVKCFAQQKGSSDVWMGSKFNGLLRLSDNGREWFNAEGEKGALTSNNVTALRFDNQDQLWIGTAKGLNLLNVKNSTVKSWTEQDGLASNRISAIEIDDNGRLWISTSNGLSMFNPEDESFKNYYVEDGLQGNQFEMYVSLKADNGNLYFGGSNGFNLFHPDRISDNPNIPQIHFTGFKIANKSVSIGNEYSPLSKHIDRTRHIALNHNQSDFTFEFVALNYTSPGSNNYRYKLEGYDENWIEAGSNRIATYTNISPGDYTFRVEASNNDDRWNNEGRSVAFSIAPPPWKTKWAYILYLIIIGLMVMGLYYFIVKRIEQESLLEIERREREKSEQMNQLKLRFFTNISHEFRTPLTLIASPLAKLISQTEVNTGQRHYLYSTMQKNVKRLLRLVKQLMDFRKLENQQFSMKVKQGNLRLFIHEIVDGFKEYAAEKAITIDYHYLLKNYGEQWFDHNIIDSVIFNLLSNAIKFSPKGSTINVVLEEYENGQAIIKVIDHGMGIGKDKIDKVFERFYSENQGFDEYSGTGIGLAFSQSLIKMHGGEITVKSEPGVETVFTVNVPINKEAFPATTVNEVDWGTNVLPQQAAKEEYAMKVEPEQPAEVENKSAATLLFVEDNIELRKFLKNHFTNYQVLEANDGKEALAVIKQSMPDLIVSDVMMPNMDGVSFCKAVKSSFITSHIPVVMLTAKAAVEHKIEGIENGADAYIEKPFDIGFLEVQIQSLLKQRQLLRKRFSNHFETQPAEVVENLMDKKFFEKAEKIVHDNIANNAFSVEDMGTALGMSRSQLFRKFKALTDSTPSDYIRAERLKVAKKMLMEGQFNVNEVSLKTGFNSTSHFISTFKKYIGITPKEFSKKQG